LMKRFPALPAAEVEGCHVAIDGELVMDPFLESLAPQSRVIFVQRIGAG